MKRSPAGRWGVAALALVAGLAVAGGALARGPHGGGCQHKEGHFGPRAERLEQRIEALDLQTETRQAVYALLDEAREQRREFRGEMRGAHEQMRALLDQESPAPEAVLAQADTLGALHTEARKAELRTLLAVRELLTPEQWQTLRERPERGPGARSPY